jgi:hypothetical protein
MSNYILRNVGAASLPPIVKRDLIKTTLLWTFRQTGHTAFRRYLKEVIGVSYSEVKAKLTSSGYLMKNLKLAIFYAAKNKVNWLTLKKMFKLNNSDRRLVAFGVSIVPEHLLAYPALTLVEFDAHLAVLHKNLTRTTNKFVNRKMSFIIKSDNVSMSDLTGDLLFYGMQGVYWYYPSIDSYPNPHDRDHATNIAQRIIHNRGINLIRYFTQDCRSVMMKTSDGGFANRRTTFEAIQAHNLSTPNDVVVIPSSNLEGTSCDSADFTINELIKSVDDPKWSTFIRLMGGKHDNIFTQWLKSKKLTQQSNEEFFNQVVDRRESQAYFNIVCDYLNLQEEQKNRYVCQVQWLCC